MRKAILASLVLLCSTQFMAQTVSNQPIEVINITKDTTINGTISVSGKRLIINGNYFNIKFTNATINKFYVENGVLLIKNARIANMKNWGSVGRGGELQWHSVGMVGCMVFDYTNYDRLKFLDGQSR